MGPILDGVRDDYRATVVLVTGARADPLPQPKPTDPGGSCPYGYFISGSVCVPSQGAQDAVPKPPNGTCPWGWTSSGVVLPAERKSI
jgi:hypothetical protein